MSKARIAVANPKILGPAHERSEFSGATEAMAKVEFRLKPPGRCLFPVNQYTVSVVGCSGLKKDLV